MASWKKIITNADFVTGAVSNGATTIPTGNDVHDFVVVQGYSTATGVANNADVTGSNACNSPLTDGTQTIAGAKTFSAFASFGVSGDYAAEFTSDVKIIESGSNPRLLIGDDTGGSGYGEINWNSSANSIQLGTATAGANTLILDQSDNATFAGNVSIDKADGTFYLKNGSGTVRAYLQYQESPNNLVISSNEAGSDITLLPAGNTALTLADDLSATFGGTVRVPDGSASEPTITNTGDTNTGIFWKTADTLAFSTGGTERGYISGSGNLEFSNADLSVSNASIGANTDIEIKLGRAKLSSTGSSDQPILSHYDNSSTTNYSWSQNSSGRTILNAKTGQDIDFRINNVTKVSVNQDGILEAGEIRATAEVTAYYGSDIAMKKNVKSITNPLDKIMSIGGYNFDWKAKVLRDRGGEDGYFVREKDVGIIAQEVEKVCPEIVATRKDGHKAVKYDKLVPLLIESIKELTTKVTRLENGNR